MSLKTKILFIGNCQASAIANILNLDKNIFDVSIISIHLPFDQEKTLDCIKNADIIVAQRIRQAYGNASTISVLEHRKYNSVVILYNSCYMKLYYFDSTYYTYNNIGINEPCPYHYNSIINSYKNNLSVDQCDEYYIKNKFLQNKNQLLSIFNNDLEQLSLRYKDIIDMVHSKKQTYTIDIVNFIRNNYNRYLLFYSFNHPANILLKYICEQIVDILKIKNTINNSTTQLGQHRCILYTCLSNILDFDISKYPTRINNIINTNSKNIINEYYTIYNKLQ